MDRPTAKLFVLNQAHLENRNFVAGAPEDLTPRYFAISQRPLPIDGEGDLVNALDPVGVRSSGGSAGFEMGVV
jgi:hypothetical protein